MAEEVDPEIFGEVSTSQDKFGIGWLDSLSPSSVGWRERLWRLDVSWGLFRHSSRLPAASGVAGACQRLLPAPPWWICDLCCHGFTAIVLSAGLLVTVEAGWTQNLGWNQNPHGFSAFNWLKGVPVLGWDRLDGEPGQDANLNAAHRPERQTRRSDLY